MAHRDDAGHIILFGKIKNFFDLFFVIPSHNERPQIHRPCGKAEMIRRHARIKRLPVGSLCRRRFSIRFIAGKPFYCAKHDERRRFVDVFRIPGKLLRAFISNTVLQIIVQHRHIADRLRIFPAGNHLRDFHHIFDVPCGNRLFRIIADTSPCNQAFDCVHSTILQTTKNPFLYYTEFLKIRHCFMRKTNIFFC